MIEAFKQWIAAVIAELGYVEIFFLMALESSLFPVPSELVMIPAGYLARGGALDPVLATLAGGSGSLLGATANYLLGRHVGRAFLLKYGRYLLINEAKYHEAEGMFLGNARMATFIGRFIPVVRHLISLPPGVFGMAYPTFAAITFAGATLWCGVLAAAGYYFGEASVQVITHYTHELAYAALAMMVAGLLWFLFRKRA